MLHALACQFVTVSKTAVVRVKYDSYLPRSEPGWIVLPALVSLSRQALDELYGRIFRFVAKRETRSCEQKQRTAKLWRSKCGNAP